MTQSSETQDKQDFTEETAAEFKEIDIERDRAIVGLDFPVPFQEFVGTATPEAIRNFANGHGDDNPLFTDPSYGLSTRWGSQVAPPIMAAVLNAPLLGEKPTREQRGGSYRGIHAFVSGGTWEWYRPVYSGDTIYSFGGLESIEEKRSEFAGRSIIKVTREVKMNQHAEVVGVYRVLTIYTERKTARDRGKYKNVEVPHYTDKDLAKIDEIYANEQRRGAQHRYFEEVEIGEKLPQMVKGPLSTTDIIIFHAGGYGFVPYGLKTGRLGYQNRQRIAPFYIKNEYGAYDVAQRVHWDSEWARAIGNPRAYDYGVLRECWANHFLTDWTGDDGWVIGQHDEIRKFNYQGDVQVFGGEVVDKYEKDGRFLVDLTFEAINQRDEQTMRGTATVALPSRGNGAALIPEAPVELQRKAIEMMARHGELLRADK